ncbi:helix-turn-helix domain-containing protein [Paenibacillus hemerocallicola]|uniref:helix-turn-helix domain-containing protein n=1 Tax=Paenibacillus hemerocallicola TaxID=1172614 RepID=UPI00159ECB60|nr:helix-turn-helix transcriptional regulator [Paenibacillus hemerocallicola]
MSEFIKLVGSNIRELRKAKGFTQAELGEKMQISQSYIGEIERGQVNVSLETLEKVTLALELSLFDLFNFKDIDIDENQYEKETLIEVHKQLLSERNLNEIKMFHQIIKNIIKMVDHDI